VRHQPHWQHMALAYWSTNSLVPNLIQVWSIHYRIHRGADEASQITGCSEQCQRHTYIAVSWIDMGIYENIARNTCYHNPVVFVDSEYKYEDQFTQPGYICTANRLHSSYTLTPNTKGNPSMLKLTR
jgi:hypothetical protein